jgi:hypothetical protein
MEQNQILNAANALVDGVALLEVETLLGKRQAFGLIANKCSAADTARLRENRDNRHCEPSGSPGKSFAAPTPVSTGETGGKVRAGADFADSPLNPFDFGPDSSIISDWLASYD